MVFLNWTFFKHFWPGRKNGRDTNRSEEPALAASQAITSANLYRTEVNQLPYIQVTFIVNTERCAYHIWESSEIWAFFFFKQCKEESYVYVFRAMYIEKTNSLTYGPINPIISDQANTSQLLRKKKRWGGNRAKTELLTLLQATEIHFQALVRIHSKRE